LSETKPSCQFEVPSGKRDESLGEGCRTSGFHIKDVVCCCDQADVLVPPERPPCDGGVDHRKSVGRIFEACGSRLAVGPFDLATQIQCATLQLEPALKTQRRNARGRAIAFDCRTGIVGNAINNDIKACGVTQLSTCFCLYAPRIRLPLQIDKFGQVIDDIAGVDFLDKIAKTIGVDRRGKIKTGAVVAGIKLPVPAAFAPQGRITDLE